MPVALALALSDADPEADPVWEALLPPVAVEPDCALLEFDPLVVADPPDFSVAVEEALPVPVAVPVIVPAPMAPYLAQGSETLV